MNCDWCRLYCRMWICCGMYDSLQDTHTHITIYGPLSGTTRLSRHQKNLLLSFMVQGKITEADAPTIRLGTTPPPPSWLVIYFIFMLDALPAAILPIYPGLVDSLQDLCYKYLIVVLTDDTLAIVVRVRWLLVALRDMWLLRCFWIA